MEPGEVVVEEVVVELPIVTVTAVLVEVAVPVVVEDMEGRAERREVPRLEYSCTVHL